MTVSSLKGGTKKGMERLMTNFISVNVSLEIQTVNNGRAGRWGKAETATQCGKAGGEPASVYIARSSARQRVSVSSILHLGGER